MLYELLVSGNDGRLSVKKKLALNHPKVLNLFEPSSMSIIETMALFWGGNSDHANHNGKLWKSQSSLFPAPWTWN